MYLHFHYTFMVCTGTELFVNAKSWLRDLCNDVSLDNVVLYLTLEHPILIWTSRRLEFSETKNILHFLSLWVVIKNAVSHQFNKNAARHRQRSGIFLLRKASASYF